MLAPPTLPAYFSRHSTIPSYISLLWLTFRVIYAMVFIVQTGEDSRKWLNRVTLMVIVKPQASHTGEGIVVTVQSCDLKGSLPKSRTASTSQRIRLVYIR